MIYRLIMILSLVCSTLVAQDMSHPLTLSELVSIALENNPDTKQAWWNAQRAAHALGISKSSYYPSVGIDAFASNGRTFKFVNGPDVNYTIVGADLTLSFMLFDFGERSASVNAAKYALLAANWQTDWAMQKVIVKVLDNAYSTLNAYDILQASYLSLDDAEKVLNAAKELNRAGLTAVSDIYSSSSFFSQMQMDVAERKAQLDINKAKLATVLGMDPTTLFVVAPIDDLISKQNLQVNELISLAKLQRADLMAKQARLSESQAKQDVAYAGYTPKLSLSGRGGAEHAYHDKSNGAHYDITLNLNIPLFDGFNTVYQNRLAFADTQISIQELAQLELDIALEVLTYSRNLEAAQEMLSFADNYLQNATKAYEGVLEKYSAGKERIAEVSNAQQLLTLARIRYSNIKTKYLVAIANLAYATGTLAPYMEAPCEINP